MSFNWLVYKHLNPDLKLSTSQQYEKHYLENGKKEGRKKSVYDLYPDFNPMIYRNNYSNLENLTVFELELHWLVTGVKEERSYYNILSIINGMSLIITEEAEEIKNTNEYDNIIKELNLDNVENEVECENKENKENDKIKEDKHLDKKILVVVNNKSPFLLKICNINDTPVGLLNIILNLSFFPSPFGVKALGIAKGIGVPVISADAVAVVDANT